MRVATVTVRTCSGSEEDIAALTALMNQWDDLQGNPLTPDAIRLVLERITAGEMGIVLLAESGGRTVGYAYFTEVLFLGMPPVVELQSILVDSAHRQHGIGSALLVAGERWARERGVDAIMLSSRVHLTGAHDFYRRHGYDVFKQSYYFKKNISGGRDDQMG